MSKKMKKTDGVKVADALKVVAVEIGNRICTYCKKEKAQDEKCLECANSGDMVHFERGC